MARHPRTIYRPVYVTHQIDDTTIPDFALFKSLSSVSADASEGVVVKHIETSVSLGLTATAATNTDRVSGFTGYFKWPQDAAEPTLATIDLQNRTKIFGRRNFVVQGLTTTRWSQRIKSARLTLGEELFFFIDKLVESSADIFLRGDFVHNFWETKA